MTAAMMRARPLPTIKEEEELIQLIECRPVEQDSTVKSMRRWGLLLVAFCLMACIQIQLLPAAPDNPLSSSPSSLRVQTIRHHPRRRLQQQQLQPNNAIYQLDIMVPVFERDSNLKDFAKRLKPSLEEYAQLTANNITKIATFRLLTTRYGQDEQASAAQFQQELAHLTGLALPNIVLVNAPPDVAFSRAHAVNLMLQASCSEVYCLVARIDVDMDVKASFFLNSERDVVAGQSAYFPIVWSAFHPMSPELVQWHMDVQMRAKNQPRMILMEHSPHKGHWRDYGTGMWAIGGPDAKVFRFNEEFKGWGGEDGDFYNRIKEQRKIIRYREPGLIHLWHPKYCTKGVTVFTDTQINECNWSRDGEKGSDIGRRMLDKWMTQWDPEPVLKKPIWQA